MRRHPWLLTMGLLAMLGGVFWIRATVTVAAAGVQNPSPQPETSQMIIKTESNLVVVNVIATDKKGNYIQDLQKADFRVFEDDAEQTITAFSHETEKEPNGPAHPRYMVLFFDDSTMDPSLQTQARAAAAKFVESTASPNRLMAVVDFGGTLKVAQNFTADGDLLKKAVSTVKFSALNPNAGSNVQVASLGGPSLSRTQGDFAARSVLLSMRDVAKLMIGVPGRKTMILFSSGFALTPERQSELIATIDALNKANIAVYPVDVRGLAVSASPGMDVSRPGGPAGTTGFPPQSELRGLESPFPHWPGLFAAMAAPAEPEPQRGGVGGGSGGGGSVGGGGAGGGSRGGGVGGGSTGTGGGSRGGTTGSTGTGTGSNPSRGGVGNNNPNNPNSNMRNNNMMNQTMNCMNANTLGEYQNPNCNRQIIPSIPNDVSTNQQVLYALAKGTGGFEIFNTNDFLKGLEKVAKEMNEYYSVGYAPPGQVHDGSFHRIKVQVTHGGVVVRYRNGYYDLKSPDLLKDKPEGKALEARAESDAKGDIPVTLSAPYFYTEPGVARVNLALSVPGSSIDFEKEKGAFHSDVNVLGIAYRQNGTVAARFSDKVKLDYQKKELKDFAKGSFDYENTFNIAPGTYTLKLVLSAGGEKFGKYVFPLVVDPFTGSDLSLGGPALGDRYVPVSQATTSMDTNLMEDRTPLVFKGMQLVPSTTYRFAKSTQPVVYVEVFDPALKDEDNLRVGILFSIIDRKTNQKVYESNTMLVNDYAQAGNPLVPVGFKLPIEQLQAGDYRFEVKGRDADGNASTIRSAEFTVE